MRTSRRLYAVFALRCQTRRCRAIHKSDAVVEFNLRGGNSADRSRLDARLHPLLLRARTTEMPFELHCLRVSAWEMFPFELSYPGHWLDCPGVAQDDVHEAGIVFHVLESHLADAALALRLFEHERANVMRFAGPEPDAFHRRRREMEFEREQQLGPDLSPEDRWAAHERIRVDVDVSLKRERWAAGEIPEAHLRRAVFLYAQAFLFALDGIGKGLTALGSAEWVPAAVATARDEFYRSLPTLTGVRDTSHHLEDRARRRDRRGRQIALKPVENNMISAPGGGVLILGNLNGNRYGSTMEDGSFGEVEVSVESLDLARKAIQACIDAFSWRPPRHHVPSR